MDTSTGMRRGSRGRRRAVRRALWSVAAVFAVLAAGLGILVMVTPPIGDAEARVQARLRAVHADPAGPLPPRLAAAVLATEDHRFYSHPGVDVLALGRILRDRGGDPGGATIDQQLAKMLYTPGRDGFAVKAEQVGLALKLDRAYPKRLILAMYLDVAYFGHGFFGAYAASEGYFGVPPGGLDWGQAALLAGLLQQPTADDPLVRPNRARERQRHVLARLVATHAISAAAARQAATDPLRLAG